MPVEDQLRSHSSGWFVVLQLNIVAKVARVSLSKGKTSTDYKGYAVDWKPSVDVAFDTPYDRPIHYLGAKAQTVYVGR